MKPIYFAPLFFGVLLTGCLGKHSGHEKIQPAQVSGPSTPGSMPSLTLTADARRRLDIESRYFQRSLGGRQVLPVSALLYDTQGVAWVFVEPSPSVFQREQIQVLRTNDNRIVVESRIADSVPIVTRGAAELLGAESGVGK